MSVDLSEDLEKSVLQTLSETTDECGEPGWLSFEALLVRLASEKFVHSLNDDFGSEPTNFVDVAEKVIEQAVADDLVEKYEEKSVKNTQLRITAQGFYEQSGFDALIADDPDDARVEELSSYDSRAWTGLKLRQDQIDEAIAEIERLKEIVEALPLDNAKKCQALALLDAARTLFGAPEPPLAIISQIFGNFDRIIGITGLLVGWVGLVQSWTS